MFSKDKDKKQKTEILHHTTAQHPLMLEIGGEQKKTVLHLYRLRIFLQYMSKIWLFARRGVGRCWAGGLLLPGPQGGHSLQTGDHTPGQKSFTVIRCRHFSK